MRYIFFLVFLVFAGCKAPSPNNGEEASNKAIDAIKAQEEKALNRQPDDIGDMVKVFSFEVRTDDKTNFKDGIIPWAHLEEAQKEIPNLVKADEVVIEDQAVTIVIDYPLNNPYQFTLTSDKGFTRAMLLTEISKHYQELYKEEEKTATEKTLDKEKRSVINRNETNGKYGIWGHDLSDLDLSGIEVYQSDSDGKITLMLIVES